MGSSAFELKRAPTTQPVLPRFSSEFPATFNPSAVSRSFPELHYLLLARAPRIKAGASLLVQDGLSPVDERITTASL